jgi:hypothetical protein
MARKKQAKQDTVEPKFPYTTEPQALRRLLTEIPKRPRPPKITMETLKAWNVSSNNNARTAIGVLKKIGLLTSAGEPTDSYVEFMKTGIGPAVLGQRLREVYRILFENSHAPQNESNDELRKLFNIHSGGGENAMRLQAQTFKILAEYASFAGTDGTSGLGEGSSAGSAGRTPPGGDQRLPPVQIDLHIHLPESKTTREYEAIIQDIARYIYGREIDKA